MLPLTQGDSVGEDKGEGKGEGKGEELAGFYSYCI